jgi:hypothetical protein
MAVLPRQATNDSSQYSVTHRSNSETERSAGTPGHAAFRYLVSRVQRGQHSSPRSQLTTDKRRRGLRTADAAASPSPTPVAERSQYSSKRRTKRTAVLVDCRCLELDIHRPVDRVVLCANETPVRSDLVGERVSRAAGYRRAGGADGGPERRLKLRKDPHRQVNLVSISRCVKISGGPGHQNSRRQRQCAERSTCARILRRRRQNRKRLC